MTAETAHRMILAQQSPGGFDDAGRVAGLLTDRRAESIEGVKPAQAALIQFAVFLEDEGLTQGGTVAHGGADGHCDGVSAVGDGVEALIALTFDAIRVSAKGRCDERVFDEDVVLLAGFERVRHLSGGLGTSLNVTCGARWGILLTGLRARKGGS